MTDKISMPPPAPAIGVSGIAFNRQQEVLLIRRDQPPARGLWSIPGGKLEPGESLVEACQREFEEETGLKIRIVSLAALVERRVESFHYVIADFLVELIDDRNPIPIAGTDVSEARWITLNRLGDYETVPGLAEIIVKTYETRQSGRLPGLIDPDGRHSDFL